ncbi:F-box/kelch-repeat protein At3g23880-like [Lotus japonicus]|uniref:F-box/kelch-repeat protein At3g23880-like n=1 Tax=Lotus japonicus TaxID=34305 RepID=UPI0025876638|nr:F-box/kelch-repeat protein At3g23880-like [Lotus japonicus]
MEKEKEKKNLTLPHELIFEILIRLPVRSLLCLTRVCKSWLSLISDPQFAKSHFDLNVAPTHRLLLRFLNEDQVESFDLGSSLDDRSAVLTLNAPPPSMSCDRHNPLYFLGSCRGFMLLVYETTSDVIVWNPTTKFHQRIPKLDHEFMFCNLCGFGYDSASDDYFVVVITLFHQFRNGTKIYTFSMKTKSWCDTKYVNNVHYMRYRHGFRRAEPGVCLNNSLHWLVTSIDTKLSVVIAFDLGEKCLSDIPLTSELAVELTPEEELTPKGYSLRVLGGCLSLCYSSEGVWREQAEIWVMKEYKVQSSWTKVFVMYFCDMDIRVRHFYPLCFIEGGRVVGSNNNGMLMKFDAEVELLEHLKYDREYYKIVVKYFEMYRESLLFFPGEQRLLCVTEDHEESEDVEEKATQDDEEATEEEKTTGDEEAK